MYRPHLDPTPRKGVILLVVLAMLTLFTIIGISFVLYADAEARISSSAKDSNNNFRPDMEPEECLSLFLDQLIFDVRDDASGVYSSMRGHSLSRNMYGFNYDLSGTATTLQTTINSAATALKVSSAAGFPATVPPSFCIQVDNEFILVTAVAGTTWTITRGSYGSTATAHFAGASVALPITQHGNDVPFNGIGRLHYKFPYPPPPVNPARWHDPATPGQVVDDWKMINYMYFSTDGFLRDPERYGYRTSLATNRGSYLASANVPYTYPDINNFYLGAIDGTGNLLTPSFHREWLFGRLDAYPNNPSGLPVNPNWLNSTLPQNLYNPWTNATKIDVGKYLTLRPRPLDNALDPTTKQPLFPYPVDRGGDVKNLIGYSGGCDSSWMDIGAPVMTAPDGRKYKMLVAPLILELDGRLNVNAHGNVMGAGNTHVSNQGLGPWEVNLSKLLNSATASTEWVNLFNGTTGVNQPTLIGKYGPMKVPLVSIAAAAAPPPGTPAPTANLAPAIPAPHDYAQISYKPSATGRITMPSGITSCFPTYPGYDNAAQTTTTHARSNHAMLYQVFGPFLPRLVLPSGPAESPYWNRGFRVSNMERLLRYQDTGYEELTSELELLLQNNLNTVPKARNQLTTHSGDRNAPGISPYNPNYNLAAGYYGYAGGITDQAPYVTAQPVFPTLTAAGVPTPAPATSTQPIISSDFLGSVPLDWRSSLPASNTGFPSLTNNRQPLWRLDLNNPIPNLTNPLTGGPALLKSYPTSYAGAVTTPLTTPSSVRFDTDTNAGTFVTAQAERQYMARQIYLRLLAVAGLSPSGVIPAVPNPIELQPRRWLAQLAVNIVDYIDNDDISTAFNFYTPADAQNNAFDVSPTVTLAGSTGDPVPKYWVFGTELPRVVINEVLAETNPLPLVPPAPVGATFQNNVWVELFNPMDANAAGNATIANPGVNTTETLLSAAPILKSPVCLGMPKLPAGQTQLGTGGVPIPFANPAPYAAYRLIVADQILLPNMTPPAISIPDNNNVLGSPLTVRSKTIDSDFALNGGGQSPVLNINNGSPITIPAPPTPATLPAQGYLIIAPPPNTTVRQPPNMPNPGYGMDANGTIAFKSGNYPNGTVVSPTSHVLPTSGMQYYSKYTTATGTFTPDDRQNGITVLLQRLANPHIPYNGSPTLVPGGPINPWYNPYITIDYIKKVPLNDGSTTGYASVAKKQPYASRMNANPGSTMMGVVIPPSPTVTSLVVNETHAGLVRQSFGSLNNVLPASLSPPAPGHYDWLTHLDRVVTSPMEILHVSQFQPHQLTQKFMLQDVPPTPANALLRYQHAPVSTWYDETRRLYRLFEFLEVRDRALGSSDASVNGRTTGKININAVWDFETFLALCDPQSCNGFALTDVTAAWNQLLPLRSPNYVGGTYFSQTGSQVGPTNMTATQVATGTGTVLKGIDRPFVGHAQGYYTAVAPSAVAPYPQFPQSAAIGPWPGINERGINDTIFRTASGFADPASGIQTVLAAAAQNPRLFDISATTMTTLNTDNPYVKTELLRKIFNNVTTRSNVFAVWLTVGFFEVTDETARPVTLGAEMNAAEGRAVRHRMFTIVDRSILPNNPNPSASIVTTVLTPNVTPNPVGSTIIQTPTAITVTTPAAPIPGTITPTPYRPGADKSLVVPHWSIID